MQQDPSSWLQARGVPLRTAMRFGAIHIIVVLAGILLAIAALTISGIALKHPGPVIGLLALLAWAIAIPVVVLGPIIFNIAAAICLWRHSRKPDPSDDTGQNRSAP